MSTEENKAIVRRIYEELWDERKLEVADELIAEGSLNYDTGLTAHPFGPEEMKGTVGMVTAAFPDNRHQVEEMIAEGNTVVARVTLTGTHEGPSWVFRPPANESRSTRSTSTVSMTEWWSSTGWAATTWARCASSA